MIPNYWGHGGDGNGNGEHKNGEEGRGAGTGDGGRWAFKCHYVAAQHTNAQTHKHVPVNTHHTITQQCVRAKYVTFRVWELLLLRGDCSGETRRLLQRQLTTARMECRNLPPYILHPSPPRDPFSHHCIYVNACMLVTTKNH